MNDISLLVEGNPMPFENWVDHHFVTNEFDIKYYLDADAGHIMINGIKALDKANSSGEGVFAAAIGAFVSNIATNIVYTESGTRVAGAVYVTTPDAPWVTRELKFSGFVEESRSINSMTRYGKIVDGVDWAFYQGESKKPVVDKLDDVVTGTQSWQDLGKRIYAHRKEGYHFRKAKLSELEKVTAVLDSRILATDGYQQGFTAEKEELVDEFKKGNWYVIEKDGKIIGAAGIYPEKNKPVLGYRWRQAEIGYIAIDREYEGKQLIPSLLHHMKSRRKEFTLYTYASLDQVGLQIDCMRVGGTLTGITGGTNRLLLNEPGVSMPTTLEEIPLVKGNAVIYL